ncbi:MAG: thioredoxin [Rhodospirillales bacterium]|nr:thioredoxin [Rhodospirillales bacterium]
MEPGVGDPVPPAPVAAGGAVVKDVSMATFMVDVIEESKHRPVIVDFWAPWCGPCKTIGPVLEKLVTQAGGLLMLAKINVDENQEIAAQMRVQSIPAVFAFKDGQPVDGFTGAVAESQIRSFIEKLLGDAKPPIEAALEQAKAALDGGDAQMAGDIYRQIQAHDPENTEALGGIIRAALAAGDVAMAREIVDGLTTAFTGKPEVASAISALELAEMADGASDIGALEVALAGNENDLQARYDLAIAYGARGRHREAVDQLLDLIGRDRAWNEEAGRVQLLKVFAALGPTDPIVADGRRRLSAVLFS